MNERHVQLAFDLDLTGESKRSAETFLNTSEIVKDEDYSILNSPEMRTEYVRLTDRLIQCVDAESVDTIVFLDKSARPVAWLMKELWPVIGPRDEDGNIKDMPKRRFLNIDREQWGAVVGRSEDLQGGIDINRIPEDRISELRSLFTEKVVTPEEAAQEPTVLEDENVLVVDEVRASGDTLRISTEVLQRAFPEAEKILGFHWMGGKVKYDPKSGGRRITEIPVWYSDRDVTGRGVADRDTVKSMNSDNQRQRQGRYWLSTRFRDGVDEKGAKLRQECKLVARELAQHRLPYIPAPSWDSDKMVERIEKFDGLKVGDFMALRHQAERENTSFIDIYREYRADQDEARQSLESAEVS